jgi:hypothetical protein
MNQPTETRINILTWLPEQDFRLFDSTGRYKIWRRTAGDGYRTYERRLFGKLVQLGHALNLEEAKADYLQHAAGLGYEYDAKS